MFQAVLQLTAPQPVCLEVGTYKGGGSTLQILRALEQKGGILFGVEASPEIFQEMRASLAAQEPELCRRFVPVCGFSQQVIPALLADERLARVDFAFLDGGNNPREQIEEFRLLDPNMPVGSVLMAHDALLRKGKWLRRFLPLLDHYQTKVLPLSPEGLLVAQKVRTSPTLPSKIKAHGMLGVQALAPLELAARLAPAGLRSAFFRKLPRRWAAWLADGRPLSKGPANS